MIKGITQVLTNQVCLVLFGESLLLQRRKGANLSSHSLRLCVKIFQNPEDRIDFHLNLSLTT